MNTDCTLYVVGGGYAVGAPWADKTPPPRLPAAFTSVVSRFMKKHIVLYRQHHNGLVLQHHLTPQYHPIPPQRPFAAATSISLDHSYTHRHFAPYSILRPSSLQCSTGQSSSTHRLPFLLTPPLLVLQIMRGHDTDTCPQARACSRHPRTHLRSRSHPTRHQAGRRITLHRAHQERPKMADPRLVVRGDADFLYYERWRARRLLPGDI